MNQPRHGKELPDLLGAPSRRRSIKPAKKVIPAGFFATILARISRRDGATAGTADDVMGVTASARRATDGCGRGRRAGSFSSPGTQKAWWPSSTVKAGLLVVSLMLVYATYMKRKVPAKSGIPSLKPPRVGAGACLIADLLRLAGSSARAPLPALAPAPERQMQPALAPAPERKIKMSSRRKPAGFLALRASARGGRLPERESPRAIKKRGENFRSMVLRLL